MENLAYACPHCNHNKGSDFATIVQDEIVRLFNPRVDDWIEHFEVVHFKIVARSIIGQASIRIFCFNEPDLLILRQILIEGGRYP